MSELKDALAEAGVFTLEYVNNNPDALARFCDAQNALFQRVCENKPETPTTLHLLGLLTKSHIEILAQFVSDKESRLAMKDVLQTSLGAQSSDKFNDVVLQDLLMISTLWIFVQGRLKMDFSLANDHATETAQHAAPFLAVDADVIRSELMQSFYQGKAIYQRQQGKPSLWQRFLNHLSS
ncbi:hypothetical protein ACI1IY_000551 [Vibrio vulnificus]|nr:hypothetical protein [Vibrio vulnificus]